MDKYKKIFLGSITAFILGISCCWMSSLTIWIGGASLVGTILHFVEDLQWVLLLLGLLFGISTIILLKKQRKRKEVDRKITADNSFMQSPQSIK